MNHFNNGSQISKEKIFLFKQFISTMNKIHRLVLSKEVVSIDDTITTGLQAQTLQFIKVHPNSPIGELARELSLSPSAAAQLIDRLEKASWISRTNDAKDRRIIRLSITSKGIKQIDSIHIIMMKKMNPILRHLSEIDLYTIVTIHKKLLDGLEKENTREDAS